MTKRMLIDATHAEETRVVVLDGSRLEDFDVETSSKKQLKGNIYLAKVVRVEPSLQAAFVEYGGGRHGFLAFGEIHPDYYQIPVADRQRLLEMQAEEARAEEEEEEAAERANPGGAQRRHDAARAAQDAQDADDAASDQTQASGDDGGAQALPSDSAAEAEPFAEPAPDPESVAPAADLAHHEPGETSADAAPAYHPEPVAEPHHAGPSSVPHPQAELPYHAAEPPHDSAARGDAPHDDKSHDHAPHGHAPHDQGPADHAEASEGGDSEHPHRPAQPASVAGDTRYGDADVEIHPGEPVHVAGAGHSDFADSAPSGDMAYDAGAYDAGAYDAAAHDAGAHGSIAHGGLLESGHHAANAEILDDREFAPDPLDAPRTEILPPETIGGETDTYDGAAEARARRTSRLLRNYRIQEVIRRRQILLIQVVKEERGTKGAALTTYISLAGRFCVLMPNSPRGGGISRKITSAADRRRLKEITTELDIPKGMGLIVRTAGAARPKPEIKRDCEYLMRLWDDIREYTMKSIAPALIYEEASLIKRAIRDVYSRDVDEILVDGEQGWKAAHDFMRMLMPSHARKVQLWRGNGQGPLFSKQGVEAQLDAMLSPTVQLKSGGYLVLAQTEALVSIDVNSGRSTRERGIEETALKTNLEAADEVARQLRLRDLAGLIVIDFIDMESRKNNASVERRLKEALKNDRARIQVGHISHFGLLEMSRQRLRPSLAESSFVVCPHCGGAGNVRGIESSAIHVLRDIEEEGGKRRASLVMVHCASAVALFLLNNKRERLAEIEDRFVMKVHFTPDDTLVAPAIRIDRLKPPVPESERPALVPVIPAAPMASFDDDAEDIEDFEDTGEPETERAPSHRGRAAPAATPASQPASSQLASSQPAAATSGSTPSPAAPVAPPPGEAAGDEATRRRRRRRRRGRREPGQGALEANGEGTSPDGVEAHPPGEQAEGEEFGEAEPAIARTGAEAVPAPADGETAAKPQLLDEHGQPVVDPEDFDENGLPRARGPRRGRRGGRRRRREEGPAPVEATPEPAYSGPTPADPFGGRVFDIFDMMDPDTAPPPPLPIAAAPSGIASSAIAPSAVAPSAVAPAAVAPSATMAEPPHHEPGHHEPEHHELAAQEPALPEVTPEVTVETGAPAAEHVIEPHEEPQQAEPVAQAAEPLPEPESAPVIQPVVVGATDAPASERKRGWWRR